MSEDMSGMIQFESRSRVGRLKQRLKEKRTAIAMQASTKRAQRKAAKREIENIRTQERKSLQRRFIRIQERRKLAKKYKIDKLTTTETKRVKGRKPITVETTERFTAPKREIDFGNAFLFGQQPMGKKKKPGVTLF